MATKAWISENQLSGEHELFIANPALPFYVRRRPLNEWSSNHDEASIRYVDRVLAELGVRRVTRMRDDADRTQFIVARRPVFRDAMAKLLSSHRNDGLARAA